MDNINLNRENGQKLWAADWNKLVSTINQIIDAVNNQNNQPGITKLSQLINDSGFITQEDVKGKVNKGELAEVATSGSYNDLKDKPSQMTGPQGPEGKSAYQVAVQNGFIGTPQQWLNSLKGKDGVVGSDGQDGQDGITPHIDPSTKHWMIGETDTGVVAEGQDGSDGQDGSNGVDGKSAYQSYVETTNDSPIKTEAQWVASLKGVDGTNGTNGIDGQDGSNGQDGVTPHIDLVTKHWMIGETDTNILAEGVNGQDGVTPHIDSTTGNWFIGNTDTGVRALGFSGDYNDLSNKPTIPAAQIQADWNQTDNSALDYIKNKPTIPTSSGTSTQIQADWDQSDNTALDYIKNKPTIPTVPGNESASSGGNTLSVVTTGDKYNWNNKASIWSGTQAQYDALSPDYDSNTIYIITASS